MPQVLPALNGERDATVAADGKTLKSLGGWSIQFGYAVFVQGEDQEAMDTMLLLGASDE